MKKKIDISDIDALSKKAKVCSLSELVDEHVFAISTYVNLLSEHVTDFEYTSTAEPRRKRAHINTSFVFCV